MSRRKSVRDKIMKLIKKVLTKVLGWAEDRGPTTPQSRSHGPATPCPVRRRPVPRDPRVRPASSNPPRDIDGRRRALSPAARPRPQRPAVPAGRHALREDWMLRRPLSLALSLLAVAWAAGAQAAPGQRLELASDWRL